MQGGVFLDLSTTSFPSSFPGSYPSRRIPTSYAREHFWQQLIQGTYQNSSLSYISWEAYTHGVTFHSDSSYLPLLFYTSLADYPNVDSGLLTYSIKNVLQEVFLSDSSNPPVLQPGSGCFLVLENPAHEKEPDFPRKPYWQVRSFFQEKFQISLQILMGKETSCKDLSVQIHMLYSQATATMEHRRSVPCTEKSEQLVARMLELIARNKTITREELAAQIYLSPDYMSKLFKKETGKTLSNYLSEVKLEQAKYMLTETNLPVSTIASSLHYSNFSYFSKMFRNEIGMTPARYRKEKRR
jgi:AraC-like DNA-binding protein